MGGIESVNDNYGGTSATNLWQREEPLLRYYVEVKVEVEPVESQL